MVSASVTYTTTVIGSGNHASLEVPDEVLQELGTNRRAPLIVTINEHTYRSTATAVAGECRVVFPQANRTAAGVGAGDTITVRLELDAGRREVEIPDDLSAALAHAGLLQTFETLAYSHRREHVRSVLEAKKPETRARRVDAVVAKLS